MTFKNLNEDLKENCDCNLPSCIQCYLQVLEVLKSTDYLDKDHYYHFNDLLNENEMDDDLWEKVVKYWSPEALAEALKNPNEW